MGVMEKVWDTLTTVIKMNDKVERLASALSHQQAKIEDLTARIIRLETALEIALSRGSQPSQPQLPAPGKQRR